MQNSKRTVDLGDVLCATRGTQPPKVNIPSYAPISSRGTDSIRPSIETIGGVTWHYFLVHKPGRSTCLMSEIGPDRILHMFVVCASLPSTSNNPSPVNGSSTNGSVPDQPNKKPKIIHLFAAFESYLDFLSYARKIPMTRWHFFEVILGNRPQKLYFDIDIHSSIVSGNIQTFANGLISDLVSRILKIFKERGIDLDLRQHILLFSSNPPSQINPEKISFHVIVDSIVVSNNDENRALASDILKDFPLEYQQCLDDSMYSTKQQFRLYGSMKPYSNRPKTFVDEWSYGQEIIRYRYPQIPAPDETARQAVRFTALFAASCVTVTDNCRPIVVEVNPESVKHRSIDASQDFDESLLTPDMVAIIVERLPEPLLQIYHVTEVLGSLIILRRNCPAMCTLCQRIHENENAFLRVNQRGNVYFYCRRNEEQSKLVATISDLVETEILTEISSQQIQSVLAQMKRQGLAIGSSIGPSSETREETSPKRVLNIPVLPSVGASLHLPQTPITAQPMVGQEFTLEISPPDLNSPQPPNIIDSIVPLSPPKSDLFVIPAKHNTLVAKSVPELTTVHQRLQKAKQYN